jgi:indolepyruvate ferredoxin oxidoreductase beta subunit
MAMMSDNHRINYLLVGVGGQGTILASDILAEVGMNLGYQVKKAEIHGMSQRGGSVVSHVRWGTQVFSPIIEEGKADILIAFEKLEACRSIMQLRRGGIALVNDYTILPITVTNGQAIYPTDEQIHESLTKVTNHIYWIKGIEMAERLGNIRVANIVLLGALSTILEQDEDIWLKVIEAHVPPKYLEINREAFRQGRRAASRAS